MHRCFHVRAHARDAWLRAYVLSVFVLVRDSIMCHIKSLSRTLLCAQGRRPIKTRASELNRCCGASPLLPSAFLRRCGQPLVHTGTEPRTPGALFHTSRLPGDLAPSPSSLATFYHPWFLGIVPHILLASHRSSHWFSLLCSIHP